ncbi:MAG: 23S rRNA (uracil(1939)-C(5))-methyltransferase RlmD [Lachnospiraceae bacterium]|nr:23S rRNA (uracil(1939)-C(5))-methyltransferase RlmD [Lachnospiraceae bacterium]
MKKGEIVQGYVEKCDFPNKGRVVIKEEGADSVVTVKNALPGQTVSCVINKKKHGKAEGRLLEVIAPAECEVEAPCPHAGICGGCLYQTYPYEEQLKIKRSQVEELIRPVYEQFNAGDKRFDEVFEGIKASPVKEGYRNKMEFSFGDEFKGGPLSLGMHKRGSFYDIVSVTDCRIVDEDYRQILSATREYFAKEELPFFHRLTHQGYLRHLLVRKAVKTGEILIGLITTSGQNVDLKLYIETILALPLQGRIAGIVHTVNDSVADVVKNEGTTLLYGKDYFYEELLGLRFKITQFSFFQTNSLGAEVLYDTTRSYLGTMEKENPVVFDLYSGTGTIAQLLAPVAGKVVGVEIVEEAVEAARENAALNDLTNCEFIAGDVLKVLDDIAEKPDYIILDPPRDGIHPKALQKIISYGVDRIVYVSCKPTSLARDLEALLQGGYHLEKMCCVDMFPNTANVETVALLKR